jgi:thiol-disulfide isomerase/thioredoxin
MNQAKFLLMLVCITIQPMLAITHPALAQFLAPGDPKTIGNTFLTSESGQRVQIASFRGNVVFINFWGSWCPPCIAEMASIRKLQAQLKDNRAKISFIFISARPEAFQKDAEWLKEHGITGKNYQWEPRFPEQRYAFFGALPQQLTFGVPTTYVLDRHGAVAETVAAPVDWETYLGTFQKLVSGRPPERHYQY